VLLVDDNIVVLALDYEAEQRVSAHIVISSIFGCFVVVLLILDIIRKRLNSSPGPLLPIILLSETISLYELRNHRVQAFLVILLQ
jgi:hypothetical protein